MIVYSKLAVIFSQLFINLAAFWLGGAFVAYYNSRLSRGKKVELLIYDFLYATVSMAVAYLL